MGKSSLLPVPKAHTSSHALIMLLMHLTKKKRKKSSSSLLDLLISISWQFSKTPHRFLAQSPPPRSLAFSTDELTPAWRTNWKTSYHKLLPCSGLHSGTYITWSVLSRRPFLCFQRSPTTLRLVSPSTDWGASASPDQSLLGMYRLRVHTHPLHEKLRLKDSKMSNSRHQRSLRLFTQKVPKVSYIHT